MFSFAAFSTYLIVDHSSTRFSLLLTAVYLLSDSCLFTFLTAVCLVFDSFLFTISAVCLLLIAVCLHFQLFVCFFEAVCLLFDSLKNRVVWTKSYIYCSFNLPKVLPDLGFFHCKRMLGGLIKRVWNVL